ncbi:MAG: hypothetical protein FDZ70_06920 [Actinobacteria bacterium]|nr:MAG: hypothetical protein FDZ70_06920 [Actinomycetota bacterium]
MVDIAAGGWYTVGLKADGTVLAVGSNECGECGVSEWTDITAVAAGYNHTVGLTANGTAVSIGDDSWGQSGVADWDDLVAVAAGVYHTVGLKADGTVVAVGMDFSGQCNVSPREPIVAITATEGGLFGLERDGTVVALARSRGDVCGWTDITAIGGGYAHAVGLRSDGSVVAAAGWISAGDDFGQCDVSDWTDIVAVAGGFWHTIGLRRDGTVVAAGSAGDGRCDVSDWTDIAAVACGNWYTLGLRRDGTVLATAGSSGDVSDWSDIAAVAAGGSHNVGLKRDGTVVATGSNDCGQCDVSDWTDIVAVQACYGGTIGLKPDGTVVVTNPTYALVYGDWGTHPNPCSIGGTGSCVGLRAVEPTGALPAFRGWGRLEATIGTLSAGSAVKFAVRTSADGIEWSEPLGRDGEPIDWTTGSGNYLGRASEDVAAFSDMSAVPASQFIDIVVRLEGPTALAPELQRVSVTALHATLPREETDSRPVWAGTWGSLVRTQFSQGTARYVSGAGKSVEATFCGTAISWIGSKTTSGGRARVYLDGVYQATVDMYASPNQFKQVLWSVSELPLENHVLRIESTTGKNAKSTGYNVWVDRFDVTGELLGP